MREKYQFFKKIGIVALLALIIVPAGVMAAGFHGSGTGKLAASADGQLLAENSLVPGGQYSFSSHAEFGENTNKGNAQALKGRNCTIECDQGGDQLRDMTKDQVRGKQCEQGGDQLRNMTKDQAQGKQCEQGGDQLRNMTKDQVREKQCDQGGDQLRNMMGTHARLDDGSCGNCPVK
jgi:hypothetical protein